MTPPDLIDADRLSAPGGLPLLVVDAASWRHPGFPLQAVTIGTDARGQLPQVAVEDFDLLLTAAPLAPKPWVSVEASGFDGQVARLASTVHRHPFAATIAAQTLRLTSTLSIEAGLMVESLAYSTLLGGAEFKRWRHASDAGAPAARPASPLRIEHGRNLVTLTLDDPGSYNAMSAAMRDALYGALVNVLEDPSQPDVVIRGAGRCFSTGGALAEFGTAHDLAEAHAVRTLHSCARLLDATGARATVRLHGACIGSGIEIAAAAGMRIASPDAWFQLPELAMGLLPGAGGTVTVSRAIGRHRAMWLLLSGRRLSARQALAWGLVHRIEDAA